MFDTNSLKLLSVATLVAMLADIMSQHATECETGWEFDTEDARFAAGAVFEAGAEIIGDELFETMLLNEQERRDGRLDLLGNTYSAVVGYDTHLLTVVEQVGDDATVWFENRHNPVAGFSIRMRAVDVLPLVKRLNAGQPSGRIAGSVR